MTRIVKKLLPLLLLACLGTLAASPLSEEFEQRVRATKSAEEGLVVINEYAQKMTDLEDLRVLQNYWMRADKGASQQHFADLHDQQAVDGFGAELHDRFGRLPFADLFEPAIRYATDGYLVSPTVHRQWQAQVNDLLPQPGYHDAVRDLTRRHDVLLIIDEAQNLTPKQMKTLITRAGPGTKVVCLGNIAQIDTPYLTEGSSGLTYVVDRFKGWSHSGHVTLQRGERSRLAEHAAEVL